MYDDIVNHYNHVYQCLGNSTYVNMFSNLPRFCIENKGVSWCDPLIREINIVYNMPSVPRIHVGDCTPTYCFDEDIIIMPGLMMVSNTTNFIQAFLHELVHSTGNKKRLYRPFAISYDRVYRAREEVIAELGSLMLCKKLGIYDEVCINSFRYIRNWLVKVPPDQNNMRAIYDDALAAYRYIVEGKYDMWYIEDTGSVTTPCVTVKELWIKDNVTNVVVGA